jgi:hypothetical protein
MPSPIKVLDWLGIELETSILSREELSKLLQIGIGKNLKEFVQDIHRDASTESPMYEFSGLRLLRSPNEGDVISFMGDTLYGHSSVVGGEIVSQPLTEEEKNVFLHRIIPLISNNGVSADPRSALHFHVGFPYYHENMVKALMVARVVDPVLFRIAGMGGFYRGEINSSIFARPVGSPPAVKDMDNRWWKMNPLRAVSSTNLADFWKMYAGISDLERPDRSFPIRYSSVNLFSVLAHGTLEYRHFNSTNIPVFASNVGGLCMLITKLIDRLSIPEINNLPVLPYIFNGFQDKVLFDLLENLIKMARSKGINTCVSLDVIKNIFKVTPHPVIQMGDYKTHSKYKFNSMTPQKCGWTECSPLESGHIDIHTFGF